MSGSRRRTGAISGSVIWITTRTTGLEGSGATQLRITRTSTAQNT